jgi:hypothetical protein
VPFTWLQILPGHPAPHWDRQSIPKWPDVHSVHTHNGININIFHRVLSGIFITKKVYEWMH